MKTTTFKTCLWRLLMVACALLFAVSASANPVVPGLASFEVVAETVSIRVEVEQSIVSGDYHFQPVATKGPMRSEDLRVVLPVFAVDPKLDANAAARIARARLHSGERIVEPSHAYFSEPAWSAKLQGYGANARLLWLEFVVPTKHLKTAFTFHIDYTQPHYRFDGRLVAAYLPLLPALAQQLGRNSRNIENFHIAFETEPGVHISRVTSHGKILEETQTRFALRPADRENIAVSVVTASEKTKPK